MHNEQKPSWLLSEEEINSDLRSSFVGYHIRVNLDDLVDKVVYVPIPRNKENLIRNYSVGVQLRNFLIDERSRAGWAAKEVLPSLLTPICLYEEFCKVLTSRRKEGLKQLRNMKMIAIGYLDSSFDSHFTMEDVIRIGDYNTIKASLVKEALDYRGIRKKQMEETVERKLGMFKHIINTEISGPLNSTYQEFMESEHSGSLDYLKSLLLKKKKNLTIMGNPK